MPLVFSKEEVREILTEMGYSDMSEEILHSFIKDLKKLIKYEERKRRRKLLGHQSLATTFDTTASVDELSLSEDVLDGEPLDNRQDSFGFLTPSDLSARSRSERGGGGGSSSSSSSNSNNVVCKNIMKMPLKSRENIITSSCKTNSVAIAKKPCSNSASGRKFSNKQEEENMEKINAKLLANITQPSNSLSSSMKTSSYSGDSEDNIFQPNPKLFIPMVIRKDPVSLYHFYKCFWDRIKIPGEDKHLQLRWNVRAVTEVKPCLENGQLVDYLRGMKKKKPKSDCGLSAFKIN